MNKYDSTLFLISMEVKTFANDRRLGHDLLCICTKKKTTDAKKWISYNAWQASTVFYNLIIISRYFSLISTDTTEELKTELQGQTLMVSARVTWPLLFQLDLRNPHGWLRHRSDHVIGWFRRSQPGVTAAGWWKSSTTRLRPEGNTPRVSMWFAAGAHLLCGGLVRGHVTFQLSSLGEGVGAERAGKALLHLLVAISDVLFQRRQTLVPTFTVGTREQLSKVVCGAERQVCSRGQRSVT